MTACWSSGVGSVCGPCLCIYHFLPTVVWQLQVRQDRTGCFYVDGQTHQGCSSFRSAMSVMCEALVWRHTRPHRLNNFSSRSHCLVAFNIKSQDSSEDGASGGVRRYAYSSCSTNTEGNVCTLCFVSIAVIAQYLGGTHSRSCYSSIPSINQVLERCLQGETRPCGACNS